MLLDTFIDFGEMKSGSSVRPQRMYDAFKELGYDVSLLEGLPNRKRERWHNVYKKYKEIKNNLPDFCYIEPPSGPFFNFCDHLFLMYLHRKKVPIGLFYRDAYWKFGDRWKVLGLKKFFLVKMFQFDCFIIKHTCKVVFFPSETMGKLFDFKNKSILPPAGVALQNDEHPIYKKAVYVGGLSKAYGTDMMLEAFKIINKNPKMKIGLTVCCRKNEMGSFFDDYKDAPWLNIVHLSGDNELRPLYCQSDIGLFLARRDIYMDFCIPIKLFEYLSNDLPIVTTDCKETAGFVQKYAVGAVAKDNPDDIAKVIISFINDETRLRSCRENAKKALLGANLWQHRAEKAASEILE